MASCGRLEIGLLPELYRKVQQADLQSAAGYQPALQFSTVAACSVLDWEAEGIEGVVVGSEIHAAVGHRHAGEVGE